MVTRRTPSLASPHATVAAQRWYLAAVILIFCVSRIAFHWAGVRFDATPLSNYWQYVDPNLLRHDLLRSLYYLHSQPPLYNLFLGIVLKLSPGGWTDAAFASAYSLIGLLIGLCLYRLLARLGVGPLTSLLTTTLFLVMPASILYENYLFYTYPSALLLIASILAFARMVDAFSFIRGLAFFSVLAALIYTRSLFQVEWFAVLLIFSVWVLPGHRRGVLLAAALPLLIVLALYAKNAVLFGQPATSSWLGISLAKVSTMQLPQAEREHMVRNDELSRLALIKPFGGPDAYPRFTGNAPVTGEPVLDRRRKADGSINFNYIAYLAIAQQYKRDALTVIKTRPGVYLRTMANAWREFFRPSSDYPFLQANRARIEPWTRVGNRYIAGQPHYPPDPGFAFAGWETVGFAVLAGFALCVLYGAGRLWTACVRPARASAATATLALMWLDIVYVSVIGNAFEIDENQRFRFVIDPLIAVMLTLIVWRLAGAGCRRLRDARA